MSLLHTALNLLLLASIIDWQRACAVDQHLQELLVVPEHLQGWYERLNVLRRAACLVQPSWLTFECLAGTAEICDSVTAPSRCTCMMRGLMPRSSCGPSRMRSWLSCTSLSMSCSACASPGDHSLQ